MSVNLNRNTLQSSLKATPRGVQYNDFEAEVIVIGGGGKAGVESFSTNPLSGNGGGAGSFISASFLIPATSSLFIQVGQGGSASLSGGTVTLFPSEASKIVYGPSGSIIEELFIAPGGGNGSSNKTAFTFLPSYDAYGDGGSAGGNKNWDWSPTPNPPAFNVLPATIPNGSGSRPAEVYGYDRTGSEAPVAPFGAGTGEPPGDERASGGGVNNSGSIGSLSNRVAGGAGINFEDTFLNGIRTNGPAANGGQILPGVNPTARPHTGAAGGLVGNSGIVAIKYFGEQKLFGGEVITQEDYTIHVFTSSQDVTTTGKTYSGSDVDIPVPQIPITAMLLGGGGGVSNTNANAGGGAGAAVSASFIMGRNVTFNIHVGSGSGAGLPGEDSYLYGFTDSTLETYSTASTELTMSAGGGKNGQNNLGFGDGGDSGEGFYKLDETIQYFPSYSGGAGGTFVQGGQTYLRSGGGAGAGGNGEDARIEGVPVNGRGGPGIGNTIVENSLIPYNGVTQDLNSNRGGDGAASIEGNPDYPTPLNGWGDGGTTNNVGRPGLLIFNYPQYYDRYDIQVTGNVTSSLRGGTRIHQFNIGDGTIRLSYSPTGST